MHAKKFNLKSEQVKAKREGKGKQLQRAILEKGCPLKSERQTGLGLKKYLAFSVCLFLLFVLFCFMEPCPIVVLCHCTGFLCWMPPTGETYQNLFPLTVKQCKCCTHKNVIFLTTTW